MRFFFKLPIFLNLIVRIKKNYQLNKLISTAKKIKIKSVTQAASNIKGRLFARLHELLHPAFKRQWDCAIGPDLNLKFEKLYGIIWNTLCGGYWKTQYSTRNMYRLWVKESVSQEEHILFQTHSNLEMNTCMTMYDIQYDLLKLSMTLLSIWRNSLCTSAELNTKYNISH